MTISPDVSGYGDLLDAVRLIADGATTDQSESLLSSTGVGASIFAGANAIMRVWLGIGAGRPASG